MRNIRLGWVWNANLKRKWSSDSKDFEVSESYSDPAVIGWKWGFAFDTKEVKSIILTPAFAVTYRQRDVPLTFAVGTEIRITRFLFIRGGFEDISSNENGLSSSITVGGGLGSQYLQLDYAIAFEGLGTKHRISTTVRF